MTARREILRPGRGCVALLVLALAIFAGVLGATPAQATTCELEPVSRCYGFESSDAQVSTTQAGAHADYTTSFTLKADSGGEPFGATATLNIGNPAGLVGNPNAVPKCTDTEFEATFALFFGEGGGGCPQDAQIGVMFINLNGAGSILHEPLYNMQAPPGSVAQLGTYASFYPIRIDIHIRSDGDYGVTAVARSLSARAGAVNGATATLWGVPADPSHERFSVLEAVFCNGPCSGPTPSGLTPKPFMANPVHCGPAQVSFEAESYSLPGQFATAIAPLPDFTGCEKLAFEPSLTVTPTSHLAGAPTGLETDLTIPQNEAATTLATSQLRNTTVILPEGMTVNPSAANGLEACSVAQVGYKQETPADCPNGSKLGSATITSPDLPEALRGSVYLRTPEPGHLFRLWLVAEGFGVRLKLPGETSLDPNTGRLTVAFDETPQLPSEKIKLHIEGGPRAPLKNPDTCGSFASHYELAPWSGNPPAVGNAPMTFDEGCAPGFAPSFTAGTVSNAAGSFSPFALSFSRNDGEQQVKDLRFTMPPGASAKLAGVPLCSDADAAAGTCPESTRIGSVTVGSGAGPDPYFLKGSVYLTGPYNGGPFGEAVVVPANAGPFHLGNVVVRGSIRIDPRTAQPTIVSDPFPRFVGSTGIPTDIRRVDVTLDRPGFTFNPTSCAELHTTGTLTSVGGASAALSQRFQTADCRALAFKPSFQVSTLAKSSRKNGAALHVVVRSGSGQANIGYVHVTLPKIMPSRLETLKQACIDTTFDANPAACPVGSRIGGAKAVTPLLAKPLSGPVYFVSHGGAGFPDIVAVLQGEGVTVELVGQTAIKNNVTSSTFASVPDVPIVRFDMTLPQGTHSVLTAIGSLCKQRAKLTMPTTIRGQNGAVVKQTTKIAVGGCPKPKKRK